jgi:hypothetical protein
MVLIPKDYGWLLRLKTKSDVIELDIRASCLEEAVMQAEQIYADACVIANKKARCQQCVHWDFVGGVCGLGFPEGKRTGGKHARDCAAFWLGR